MNEWIDFLTSNTSAAYFSMLGIFILTIILLMRRILGILLTVGLLSLALVSGLALTNPELFREILMGFKYHPDKNYIDQLAQAIQIIKEHFSSL